MDARMETRTRSTRAPDVGSGPLSSAGGMTTSADEDDGATEGDWAWSDADDDWPSYGAARLGIP